MLIFNWMEVETVSEIISKGLKNEIASNVMLAISIIFILLAIKCIFFSSSNKEKVVIKELYSKIQARIKEAIKNTSDLDVKEVNIKVKDVAPVKKSVVQE